MEPTPLVLPPHVLYAALVGRLSDVAAEGVVVANPTAEFNRLAREGAFDDVPGQAYNALRHATEKMSVEWWADSNSALAYEVLGRAAASVRGARAVSCRLEGSVPQQARDLVGRFWLGASPAGTFVAPEALLALSPRGIVRALAESVVGQPDATRAVALLLWHHTRGQGRSAVVAGPSGSGKTALARAAEGLWPDVVWVDGASLTKDGWSGANKIGNAFSAVTASEAERALVVVDEADKLFEPKHNADGEDVSRQLQTELLKLMDGGTCRLRVSGSKDAVPVSTQHMSFLLLGSFESLLAARSRHARTYVPGFGGTLATSSDLAERPITHDDLVAYGGVRREVAGRVARVAMVRPLVADDCLALLADHGRGPVARVERDYGMRVEVAPAEARAMADAAVASGLGVRSLEAQLEEMLDRRLWEGGDGGGATAPREAERPVELPWQ